MTSGRTIDYEALAQDAMRGVVRQVLTRVGKTGLPGDHHFYISFDTQQSGVMLSKRLKEKYPDEMTIVLQHRFWDLVVTDERFEVKLTFDGIPERLVVPFASIKVFFDPSVRYGLQFEDPDSAQQDGSMQPGLPGGGMGSAGMGSSGIGSGGVGGARGFGGAQNSDEDRPASSVRNASQRNKRQGRKPRLERVETAPPTPPAADDMRPPSDTVKPAAPESRPALTPVRSAEMKPVPAPAQGGGQVVSLSDFRKK